MAYIVPNSLCYLLKNVPLDPGYEHTLYFINGDTQRDYFLRYSDPNLRITDSQYIRHEAGAIKVNLTLEQCLLCNYMMFGNISFEHKWFYAFITKVEYVSNEVTRLYYTLDIMQTWITNYTIDPCWIERQHASVDNPGNNLIEEGLETGEFVTAQTKQFPGNAYHIALARNFDDNGDPVSGNVNDQIYSGLRIDVYENTAAGRTALNTFLTSEIVKTHYEGIAAIYMVPSAFAGFNDSVAVTSFGRPDNFQGYYPRNKKLLTYPYVYEYVTNLNGVSATYRYEFFSGSAIGYVVRGTKTPDANMMLCPAYYKGMAYNWDEGIPCAGFPQISFNVDSYKAWLAQNAGALTSEGVNIAIDTATGYFNTAVDLVNPLKRIVDPLSGVKGVVNTAAGSLKQISAMIGRDHDMQLKPPQNRGKQTCSALLIDGSLGYTVCQRTITAEFARIIDEYFDRYGYKMHRLGVPNRNVRACWTYVKTVDCTISGEVPADDAVEIENVYNKGVTFWNPNARFLDYSQNNYII